MDNSNKVLKEKSPHANNSEFFVFLPNNLNQIESNSKEDKNVEYVCAVAAKNAGNNDFQHHRYDAAIGKYTDAIEKFESSDRMYNLELAACYQNRAAAKEYLKDYVGSVLDASKAIELNDHYSKAYFRRAKAYFEQKRYYRSLQDIVQACILERFKNKTYTDIVFVLLTLIESHPANMQWKMAYAEMGVEEMHCDHCIKTQMQFVKKSGILNLISVPIPKNRPHVGYIKAMVGLHELNADKIMAGCKEEEDMNGPYLAQSYIVRAYLNTVGVTSPSNLRNEYPKDLRRMNELIWDLNTPENIKFNARLCRANMYNRQLNFAEANEDLKVLEEKYENNALVYLVKSGALMQLSQSQKHFMEALNKCCTLLPHVYELHFQQAMAGVMTHNNSIDRTAVRLTILDDLTKRFPNEIEPRLCSAAIYAKLGETHKAKRILKKAKDDMPNRMIELSTVYGMLKPTHSSCVGHFKRSLEFNKDDPCALKGLLEYFHSTYEYAKAIEVSNRSLYSHLIPSDFQEMFEDRHNLLKRIVQQDFWNRL